MVRLFDKLIDAMRGSPHTRGDGPNWRRSRNRRAKFSPHAWGWSDLPNLLWHCSAVLPTRVGMVRQCTKTPRSPQRSPHTRGDGPIPLALSAALEAFSPHAWGWSVIAPEKSLHTDVLPTRVGMVRSTLRRR